jgi:glucose-1-phosphate cytidylyltransferase
LINKFVRKKYSNKDIKVINTGLNCEIIDRIKKVKKDLNKNIILCYGDTLVDINLNKLILYFQKNIKKFIISSYELKSSFGILDLKDNNNVKKFKEKPKLGIWFNVGYFIFSKETIKNIGNFKKFKIFLSSLANKNKMKTFKHNGKHITVNTISELEDAKNQIDKFV